MTFLSLFCFCFTFLFSVRVSRRWIQRWKCNCSTQYVCQWALETHSNIFKYPPLPSPHLLLGYSNSFRLPNCRTLDFHSRNRTTDAPHMQQQSPHLLHRPPSPLPFATAMTDMECICEIRLSKEGKLETDSWKKKRFRTISITASSCAASSVSPPRFSRQKCRHICPAYPRDNSTIVHLDCDCSPWRTNTGVTPA